MMRLKTEDTLNVSVFFVGVFSHLAGIKIILYLNYRETSMTRSCVQMIVS